MNYTIRLSAAQGLCLTLLSCAPVPMSVTPSAPAGDWPSYGRTSSGDRHSPLTQITPQNVTRLEVAWRFHTGEMDSAFATRAFLEALQRRSLVSLG